MRLEGAVGADPQQWPAEARALLDANTRQAAKADELKRWDEFWSRSHIHINLQSSIHNPQSTIRRSRFPDRPELSAFPLYARL
ncbi:MAG: hypothetical protein WCJ66_14065 [Verrucomicrobiota bacterium]